MVHRTPVFPSVAPCSSTPKLLRIFGGLLVALITSTVGVGADWPPYLRTAFSQFIPEPPPGWAYTVTTERDGKKVSERFDPSQTPSEQWRLLSMDGAAPTEKERESYFKLKASQAPGPNRATFSTKDIEPASLRLATDEGDHATYLADFREAASSSDKMLAHLRLRLQVRKSPAFVASYRLELKEPYSPVLGVKMQELAVTMDFSPPEGLTPALPRRSASRFAGRILLFPSRENIDYEYGDFVRTP